jgi:hypothetical protein
VNADQQIDQALHYGLTVLRLQLPMRLNLHLEHRSSCMAGNVSTR